MPDHRQDTYRFTLPPLLWAGLIFALSSWSIPGPSKEWNVPLADKWAHMLLFGILAFLLYRAFRHGFRWRVGTAVLVAFCLSSLYGGFDEFHQSFVPNRDVDVWDWAADTLGAAVALLGMLRPSPVAS